MKRKREDEQRSSEMLGDGASWFRGSKIGKGSYGSVYIASLRKSRSQYRCLPSIFAVKSAEVSVSCSIQKEKEVLNNIGKCPSIIRCFGEEITQGESGKMVFNLLLEYGSGGTLAELIKNSVGKGLPESDVRRYTRSILQAIRCVHGRGYVHCDIKPDNVILLPVTIGGVKKFKAKISDFGLAKRVKQCKKMKSDPYLRGTPMYLSPEVVVNNVQEPPSDIWSLGCVVLQMLTGKNPWGSQCDLNFADLLRLIGGKGRNFPAIPSEISKEGKDFLKRCFMRTPAKRWTAEMLLNHPFVEGLVDDDVTEGEEVLITDVDLALPLLITDDELTCSSSEDESYYESDEELSYYSYSEEDQEDTDGEVVSSYKVYNEEYMVKVKKNKCSAVAPGFDDNGEASTQVSSNAVKKFPAKSLFAAGL